MEGFERVYTIQMQKVNMEKMYFDSILRVKKKRRYMKKYTKSKSDCLANISSLVC